MAEDGKKPPQKPGPVNLESIKPPTAPPGAPSGMPGNTAQFPQNLDNLPHKVIIKLTGGETIDFDVSDGKQAARFIDSVTTICEKKLPVARLGVGPDMYAIPTERILYAKLSRPQIVPQGVS
jgi:hypothetical protein